ncbi:TonB-linked outer membrane protein, SusC/RagA family [Chishuiella changwenlii]|uniref:SusC/RagA family TonB-linked outer membrane protein n=1 Tax=Chishuiella changwenlii TaxID=1434701 RepID=A0A1M7BE65_9FLAO|nr:SusC/RagA family TonB-linked outer membrane protein [Chishuiella changwenlii]GGE96636.1 SusC/RagA family TonB-linked outer membrane protein [Chishuiella changwenlii]SHL53325.1 TonB-linked outer membrane protein, SusC/RagA family [Chishuiella changwenlii]
MRRNLKSLFLLGGLLLGSSLYAQEKTVTGKVTDSYGLGVSDVVVKTTLGQEAITDEDGNFSIQAKQGDLVSVEAIGLQSQSFTVGVSNEYKISLKPTETVDLADAVVTALGITRDKKSLGYATQQIAGETVSAVPLTNFADALSGEVAGLDIKSSGTMGGSSNMIIRGFSSITGSNQALVVVDGTPINNATYNTTNQTTGRGGYDYGNAASDINPNDIETLNVLKGSAATALYGSRGQNGVIMITTKRGKKNKGIGVEFNSAITVGTADKSTLPRYQKQYGAGYNQLNISEGGHPDNPYFTVGPDNAFVTQFGADASYGAAFDPNLMVRQWNSLYEGLPNYGRATPWVAAKNDPNSIWRTSTTYVNTASFSGSNEDGSFRVSFTNNLTDGNLANSELKRNTLSFGGDYKLTDKLKATANIIYTNNKGRGRIGTGYNGLNPMLPFRQWWQTNVDLKEQEQAYLLTRKNVTWNTKSFNDTTPQYMNNFYWTRYENYQNDSRDRYTGNVSLDYKINDWLSLTGRYAFDNYDELREGRIAVGSAGSGFLGEYMLFKQSVSENNYDVMLNFNKKLTDNITLDGNTGWNLRVEKNERVISTTNGGLLIPRLYALSNSAIGLTSANISQFQGTKKVDGMYARVSLGFYNMFYLDGSIRTDRSSSLWSGQQNRYWYPSVSGSFVFSELLKGSFINFGKVRANYAQVGNDTDMFNLYNVYTLNAPFNGIGSAINPDQFKNQFLRPENMTEYEVGLEMAMFKNRVTFDVSYYNRKTTDLITPVDGSSSSGASSVFMNAGDMVNEGIEVSLNVVPFKSEDFTWRVGFNFARNRNKVTKLSEDVHYLQLASLQGGISIGAQLGEAYGVIRGTGFVYDDNGNKVVGDNGQYLASATTTKIGNMNPDWAGGIKNTISYKNLSLSFLIDFQKGGDVFSLDTFYGYATGMYDNFTTGLNDLGNPVRNTLANGGGVILPGVKQDGTPNDIRVDASSGSGQGNPWGYLGGTSPRQAHVYDASFVKLRNVTLTYDVPQKFLDNTFIKKLSLSAVGRNLWIIHKNVPFSDPEAGLSSGNIQGYQSGAHPTIREIGASLKVQF